MDSVGRIYSPTIGLLKIELCGTLNVLRLFQAGDVVYEIGEVSFHVIGINSFHVSKENERFIAVQMSCRQNLKFQNLTSSIARLRQRNVFKRSLHVQSDHFFSFN